MTAEPASDQQDPIQVLGPRYPVSGLVVLARGPDSGRGRPGTRTGAELERRATRRPWLGEQLALVGDHHFLGLGAVAQLKEIIEATDHLARPPTCRNRSETGQGTSRGTPRQEHVRSRP